MTITPELRARMDRENLGSPPRDPAVPTSLDRIFAAQAKATSEGRGLSQADYDKAVKK